MKQWLRMRFWVAVLLVCTAVLVAGCEGMEEASVMEEPTTAEQEMEAAEEADEMEDDSPVADEPPMADVDELAAALSEYIETVMAEEGLPGAAVAVVNGSETVYLQAFGFQDVAAGEPVTTDTLFHIGSVTKSMTGLMLATMVDDGLFEWDTPVVDIYPAFELETAESGDIVTVRHLLSMQSGIPDAAEDFIDPNEATAEDLFDFIAAEPLLGPPETEFSYSNIAASLAGYVGVMAANGPDADLYAGYERAMETRVFVPIGMESAVVSFSAAAASPHYGKSYVLDADGTAVEAEREDFDGDAFAPAGSVKADIEEMARYVSTQINEGIAPDGTRVVSAENIRETWRPGLDDYALGWEVVDVDGWEVIMHEGSFDNYLSVAGFVPELEIGFVILTNSADAGGTLVEDGPAVLLELLEEAE